MSRTVYTNCRICLAFCGLEVTVGDDNRIERIAPDKQNPHSWRDFCAKGRTANELIEHPRRILAPMKRVGDRYVEASWDEAIADIAARLRRIIDRDGPDAVATYWGNPGGFSIANAMFFAGLMDAIGTKSRYWVGSVDQNAFHIVANAMYGSDLFTLMPDVDRCKCFLFVGMNPAESAMNWLDSVPDGWRRVQRAQAEGAELIVVDPRRTPTAEKADTHVPIRPGQDWAFLLGLLKVIFDNGWEHAEDCAKVVGLDEVRALAGAADLAELSGRCEVPVEQMNDIARRFAQAPSAICLTHTGVSQNATGTIGEWFGQLLNVVTGRLDRPGGRRFEPGVVNVPKLFKLLAKPLDGVTRLRGLPAVAGYHALSELPDEITTPGRGQVKAMIINAGNPVVSGPDGAALDEALSSLELLVAVDMVQRESHRHAHWLIPGVHFLEREEMHALISSITDKPFVQYSFKAVEPPAGAREEWEFFVELALALRVPMFGRPGVNSVVKASRALARVTGRPALAFQPRWIERLLLMLGRKVRWRDVIAHPHGWVFAAPEFGHLEKALLTPDKRVHASSPELVAEARRQLASVAPEAPAEFPLLLSNRRRHDAMNSWLNELPGLHKHKRTNELEVHPDDAARIGIGTGDLAKVSSPHAAVTLTVRVSDATRRGVVVSEHGWGSRVFDPRGGAESVVFGVNRNLLVSNQELDPLSQTPAFNSTYVRVEPLESRPVEEAATVGLGAGQP